MLDRGIPKRVTTYPTLTLAPLSCCNTSTSGPMLSALKEAGIWGGLRHIRWRDFPAKLIVVASLKFSEHMLVKVRGWGGCQGGGGAWGWG